MLKSILIMALTLDIVFGDLDSTEKDYIPALKFMSIEYLDKTLIAPNPVFKFQKVNRTQFTLNAEFDLLKNLEGDMLTTTEVYFLLDNHYKFSGVRQVKNVCDMWNKNLYFLKSILQKYSNIDPCNVVKKRYWVKDLVFDTSMFPKSLPLGTYKVVISAQLEDVKFLQLAFYLRLSYYANWEKQSSNRLKIRVL